MRFPKAPFFLTFVAALTACSGGSSSSGGTTPPMTSGTVNVLLNQPFTDTGIDIVAGSALSITATGSMNHSPSDSCQGGPCVTTPAGQPLSFCDTLTGFTAPTLPCWSLIGRIGLTGTIFEIGTSFEETVTTAGELYIGPNDNYFTDNTGSWMATINDAAAAT